MLVVALLKPLLQQLGYSQQQRQQLIKGLLGTHAHEMMSVTQQLLVRYDEEAGRRCAFDVSACIGRALRAVDDNASAVAVQCVHWCIVSILR